jgi:hypothetical protein
MKTAIGLVVLFLTQSTSVLGSVFVKTVGDTTEIWDTGIGGSCSAIYIPSARLSGDTLYVVERDTMPPVTCYCYYDVCTKVAGLPPGTYTAVVTRRYESRHNDTVHVYEHPAGSVRFTIATPASVMPGTAPYQSLCRQTPESVDDVPSVPAGFLLLDTYPNPFNPSTVVRYGIPRPGRVLLRVFNVAGQEIATLASGRAQAGTYEVVFDSGKLSSGVYVCRLICDDFVVSRKMILMR